MPSTSCFIPKVLHVCVMLLEISHHTKGACGNLTIHFIMGHGAPYFPTLSSMDDEHKSVSTFKGKGTGQFPSPTEVVGSSTGPSLTVVNLTDYFSVKTAGQIMRKKLANSVPSTLFEH